MSNALPPSAAARAAAGNEPPPALDAGALAKLRELDQDGRLGIVQRVLTMFEPSLLRLQQQLQAERARHAPQAVADLAHGLKASSASVGALALAQACGDIDRRLRAGTPGDLQADITRLLTEAERALAAVRAALNA